MSPRTAGRLAVLAVLAVLAALAGAGCETEPRALHLTVRLDPAMPTYDWIYLGVGNMRGGMEFRVEDFRLVPADFDGSGAYSTILFIADDADLVEVQVDVHAGGLTVGHGRRSASTFERQDYELEVAVAPTPAF